MIQLEGIPVMAHSFACHPKAQSASLKIDDKFRVNLHHGKISRLRSV
jgi:hypothetical protein